ncbi:hypothetical protein ACIPYS_34545 [Kitasatospora sp. NPDC089913]|uniref:hypothetical protein n=1 Tax=Kitasatospora sp. NPDC089913 TaxID=3364080 RepID=UPI003810B1D8
MTPSELGAKVRAQESFAALAEAPVVVLGSAFFIDTIIEHVWNHAFAPLTRVTNVRARYSRSNWLDPRANIGAYLDTFASERL